jgi:hypothetical protein
MILLVATTQSPQLQYGVMARQEDLLLLPQELQTALGLQIHGADLPMNLGVRLAVIAIAALVVIVIAATMAEATA